MDKKTILQKYEDAQTKLEELSTMLWYIYEDYYATNKIDLYTKANNYERLRVYLYNAQSQLEQIQNEMLEFSNKAYDEIKKEIPVKKPELYIENGIKHIRFGEKYDYIQSIRLADGTTIKNMQWNAEARIPTDEELKEIDNKNLKGDVKYEFI